MVPQQFTDPRKEGLSDEEYDVLDLPKNASVGDRAEGLLENCHNGVTLMLHNGMYGYGTAKTSAYCVAENHYRYRSNGTWTLETDEDLQNDSRFQEIECTEGNLGAEYELGIGARMCELPIFAIKTHASIVGNQVLSRLMLIIKGQF